VLRYLCWGCLLIGITLSCSVSPELQQAKQPNFIVILTDDQGYSDLGCYGARGFSTPNIDRMADEGMRFTDFYAAPCCSPARASLLTGSYDQRVGIGRPLNGPDIGLHPDEITIAESLKDAGYATGIIGKWHLGLSDEMSPIAQGFDYFSGIPLSQIRHGETEHTDGPTAYYRRQWKTMTADYKSTVEYDPDETLFTRRSTEEALTFIRNNKAQPFFLYLSHPMVHRQVLASKEFSGRTGRGVYGDACEELDWSVGEVLGLLKELDLDTNTFVMYTSDNGPWLGHGDQSGMAEPLRGGKFSTFEGGLRVPCIMRWPGMIPAGSAYRKIASVMDVFPTLAELAGVDMPTDRVIDGKSFRTVMTGRDVEKPLHESFFYYRRGDLEGVRKGLWKWHLDDPGNDTWALYNLDADVGETTDVSREHPEIVAELMAELDGARKDLGDGSTGVVGANARPLGQMH
jgi:arylsulfatase A